jgi:site-specific DNA-methyltransferase (adenine-specific)
MLDADSIDSVVTDPPYGLKFMGKDWDHGVPGKHFWKEILRVAKPGAFLLAFGGTRTFHRLACAIEDAGWEVRDCIMWVYGSGFPKSMNVQQAINKAARGDDEGEWQGWGTALKPAWEPIIVARKPLIGTVVDNVLRYSTGAINIDASRIPANGDKLGGGAEKKTTPDQKGNWGWKRPWMDDKKMQEAHAARVRVNVVKGEKIGRFPANIIHDGSEEAVAPFPKNNPGCKTPSSAKCTSKYRPDQGEYQGQGPIYPDNGSAARFFYCAKATKHDRDEGMDAVEARPFGYSNQALAEMKRGTTERPATSDTNTVKLRKNNHPTVKPTNLMRYLCRLVTPPSGTILDPFMGSGSTGKAAMLEGFEFIGIDNDDEAFEVATVRVEHAAYLHVEGE